MHRDYVRTYPIYAWEFEGKINCPVCFPVDTNKVSE